MIPIFVLMIVLVAIVSKSEIGHAIADAIRHNSGAGRGVAGEHDLEQLHAEFDQLRAELEHVNSQLLEVHERLDFAERLLASPDPLEKARRQG